MDLFTPDFGLIFWMFVAFAILFLILWKFAWPSILKIVDTRAETIDKGVEYARNAQTQLENAKEQAQEVLTQARKQQADILREADRLKTQMIEEARGAAQAEAQKVMDNAKLQIEQQQKQAQKQFRDQVSDFALQIAGKVVKQNLDGQSNQTQLVDSLLDQINNTDK